MAHVRRIGKQRRTGTAPNAASGKASLPAVREGRMFDAPAGSRVSSLRLYDRTMTSVAQPRAAKTSGSAGAASKEVERFMQDVVRRNPGETEFHQAVHEVA